MVKNTFIHSSVKGAIGSVAPCILYEPTIIWPEHLLGRLSVLHSVGGAMVSSSDSNVI